AEEPHAEPRLLPRVPGGRRRRGAARAGRRVR
ncbi:MAG: hypothetical protein AVDCRST_MAG64-3363, partial [uncultured Phycisphaerae bacterium]